MLRRPVKFALGHLMFQFHRPVIEPLDTIFGLALSPRATLFCDGFAGPGDSSLPDADLSCLPSVPPVEPAWAKAALETAADMTADVAADKSNVANNVLIAFTRFPRNYLAVPKRAAPSAQTDATIWHVLPCLPQSASASSLALPMSSRAVIAQLAPE
jgi:hypothetical protein